MRRLCVVRSEGDPQPIACSQVIHVKANPYEMSGETVFSRGIAFAYDD